MDAMSEICPDLLSEHLIMVRLADHHLIEAYLYGVPTSKARASKLILKVIINAKTLIEYLRKNQFNKLANKLETAKKEKTTVEERPNKKKN